jgi:hypothetical protein
VRFDRTIFAKAATDAKPPTYIKPMTGDGVHAIVSQTSVPSTSKKGRRGIAYDDGALIVKKSALLPSGLGLFAKKAIPAETPFIEYTGERITQREATARGETSVYIFDVFRKPGDTNSGVAFHIDAADPAHSSAARYVNASLVRAAQNAEFRQVRQRIFLYSLVDIPAGKEILAHYGEGTMALIELGSRLA